MKSIKRVGKRSLFYIRQGYALASLPFIFIGYASSIYYLAIENTPFLHRMFPRFSNFLLVAGITLPIMCGLLGYFYMKRSWLFKEAAEIQTESNPYATVKLSPVAIPGYKLFWEIAKREGYTEIANELEELLKRSGGMK